MWLVEWVRISWRSLVGHPLTIRSSSMVRWSCTSQYLLHESGNCERCDGNPLRINCRNFWYSVSSPATLHSVSRWGLRCVEVMALISEIDGSGWLSISTTANMSWRDSSDTGCLESASGALLWQPVSHVAITVILGRRRCRRGFSISSSLWLFKIGISGLWSVTTWKCCI